MAIKLAYQRHRFFYFSSLHSWIGLVPKILQMILSRSCQINQFILDLDSLRPGSIHIFIDGIFFKEFIRRFHNSRSLNGGCSQWFAAVKIRRQEILFPKISFVHFQRHIFLVCVLDFLDETLNPIFRMQFTCRVMDKYRMDDIGRKCIFNIGSIYRCGFYIRQRSWSRALLLYRQKLLLDQLLL